MSDDSDDDLFPDVGLSSNSRTKKRKEENKRKARLDLLQEAVEDDAEKRQRRERLNQILQDNTDVLEQAEENMAACEKKKQEEKEEKHQAADEHRAVQNAKEMSGSDLLGTRPGALKLVSRKPLPDLQKILDKLDNRNIKKFLQPKIDNGVLPLALKRGTLAGKFDLPEKLLGWLWRCAVDYESECREGAFVTLKKYLSSNVDEQTSLNDMLKQWKDWFQASKATGVPERDRHDSLLDVHHWLELWGVLLEQDSDIKKLSGDSVADLVVGLSKIALDARFYEQNSKLGSSWCKTTSLLLEQLRAKLGDVEWTNWIESTTSRILDMDIDLAPEGSEDADDKDCLLSKALVVQALLPSDVDFGTHLGMTALRNFLGINDWENEVPKILQKNEHDWLVEKYRDTESPRPWKRLACAYCAFLIIKAKGDEIKADGPRILACIKIIQACAAAGLRGFGETQERVSPNADIAKWLALLEEQVFSLAKVMMRFSSQAHFRRSEVALSYLKSWINLNKTVFAVPESTQVQGTMANWVQSSSVSEETTQTS